MAAKILGMQIAELRAANNGDLPAYAWPGGYPMFYLAADGGILCPTCANEERAKRADSDCPDDREWRVVDGDTHLEGPPMACDNCGELIKSSYGDPDCEECHGDGGPNHTECATCGAD